MKNRILLTFFFCLFVVAFSFAQVAEEEKPMSMGMHNALVVSIPHTNHKIAEDVWENFSEKYARKTKRNRKTDEWVTEDATISDVEGAVDLYAQINELDAEVELSLWVAQDSSYISSAQPQQYKALETLLNDYALEVRIETVQKELDREKENLSDFEKDLKKLKKENEDFHKDIKNAKKEIEQAEKDLITNGEEQEKAVENVRLAEDIFADQKDTLEMQLAKTVDKRGKKEIKKMIRSEERKVKDAEKEQKSLEREEKKLYRTIEKAKQTIVDSEKGIVQNEIDQTAKEKEIENQKKVVEEVKERLKKLVDMK